VYRKSIILLMYNTTTGCMRLTIKKDVVPQLSQRSNVFSKFTAIIVAEDRRIL